MEVVGLEALDAATAAARPGRGRPGGCDRRWSRWRRRPPTPRRPTCRARRGRPARGGEGGPGGCRGRAPTRPAARPGAGPPRRRARRRPGGSCRCRASGAGSGRGCAASTGSTSLRRAASDRRRSWRRTSSSHHSRSTPSGRNSPRTTRPSRSSTLERGPHRLDADAVASRRRAARGTDRGCGRSGRRGRATGSGTDSVQAAGQADGHRDAERVAQAAGVLGRAQPLLPGDRRRGRRGAPRTSWSTQSFTGAPSTDRRSELVDRQRAEQPELVVQLVDVAGQATLDEALQLELEVGEHVGVDELAQLLGAEEVAQQVAVERERGGPALGERRVAGVHVDGDPPEHQRLGERRRLLAVDGHEPDLAAAQVAQHLDEGGHVEHVVEALAGGLEEDREATGTCPPPRAGRPSAGAAATAGCAGRAVASGAAGRGPRTPGTGRRTSPCRAAARRSAPRSRRGR